jgi:membrane protein implicated in regulation of membrane protease activity
MDLGGYWLGVFLGAAGMGVCLLLDGDPRIQLAAFVVCAAIDTLVFRRLREAWAEEGD